MKDKGNQLILTILVLISICVGLTVSLVLLSNKKSTPQQSTTTSQTTTTTGTEEAKEVAIRSKFMTDCTTTMGTGSNDMAFCNCLYSEFKKELGADKIYSWMIEIINNKSYSTDKTFQSAITACIAYR